MGARGARVEPLTNVPLPFRFDTIPMRTARPEYGDGNYLPCHGDSILSDSHPTPGVSFIHTWCFQDTTERLQESTREVSNLW